MYALTPQVRAALAGGGPAVLHLNLKPDLPAAALAAEAAAAPRGKASLPDFLKKTLHLGPPVPTLLREVLPDAASPAPGRPGGAAHGRAAARQRACARSTRPFPRPAAWPSRPWMST